MPPFLVKLKELSENYQDETINDKLLQIQYKYIQCINNELKRKNKDNINEWLATFEWKFGYPEIYEMLEYIILNDACIFPLVKDAIFNIIELTSFKDNLMINKIGIETRGMKYYLEYEYDNTFIIPENSSPKILETVPKDTILLVFESFNNNITWCDLRLLSGCNDIRMIDLGQDGVIFGKQTDIAAVLDLLPSLTHIMSCWTNEECKPALLDESNKRNIIIN